MAGVTQPMEVWVVGPRWVPQEQFLLFLDRYYNGSTYNILHNVNEMDYIEMHKVRYEIKSRRVVESVNCPSLPY